MNTDVAVLRRQLDTLIRAASRLRQHAADLHSLGWDPHIGEALEGDAPGFDSRPPRAGDPRARRLFDQLTVRAAIIEAEFIDFDRTMMALFAARAPRPEPTRGSTISADHHDWLLAKQSERDETPVRLEPQPQHPGKGR